MSNRNRLPTAPGALCLALAGLLCLSPAAALHAETLTILHSSEHHGQVLPIDKRGEKRVAGMAGRASLIAALRKNNPAVLLVDSGDILIGTPLSTFFRGEPDIKAMNLMGYQAMAAGNHEFDFGLEHFRHLTELASFPVLCSNLAASKASLPCQPFAVVKTGPWTIGIVSLLGRHNFPDTFNRQVAPLLEFLPSAETARRLAQSLKETRGVDVVVAVTHQDTDEDVLLLKATPEIDVIVGGHTEGFDGMRTGSRADPVEALDEPGPILVKTHRLGRTLGRLDLELARQPGGKGAKVLRAKAANLPVTEDVPPDPAVQALVQDYTGRLERQTSQVIGRALVTLDGDTNRVRSQETDLGNLLADLLRAEFKTEVALLNGGQIRDSIPPGPVTVKHLLRVLPFDSPTVTFTLSGEELTQALENSVSRLPGAMAGRFLQVSGLTVRYDLSAPAGSRLREIAVGGQPLDPARRYSVATDGFLADGGDGYAVFTKAQDRIDRQVPMRDLLLAALRANPLKANVEGRIQFVGKASPVDEHQHPAMTPHDR